MEAEATCNGARKHDITKPYMCRIFNPDLSGPHIYNCCHPHSSSKTPTVMHQFNQMIRYFLNFSTFIIQSTFSSDPLPSPSPPSPFPFSSPVRKLLFQICISINSMLGSIRLNLRRKSIPGSFEFGVVCSILIFILTYANFAESSSTEPLGKSCE